MATQVDRLNNETGDGAVHAQSTSNNLHRHTLFSPEHEGAAAPEEYSVLFLSVIEFSF